MSPAWSRKSRNFHILPDVVVAPWTSDGERASHRSVLLRQDVWMMFRHQIREEITSTISMAEYCTTQSGGIWLLLCFLGRLRGLQMVFEFAQAAVDAPHFGDDLPVLNKLRHRIVDAGERIIDLHHHAEGEQADKQAGTEHQKRYHPHVDQIEMLPHIEQRIVPVQLVPIGADGRKQGPELCRLPI